MIFVYMHGRSVSVSDPYVGRTGRIQLRLLPERKILKRRLWSVFTPTSHVLHPQRHPPVNNDVSSTALHIFLYACPEGPDRGRRTALLPDIPAQRGGKYPENFRSHSATW